MNKSLKLLLAVTALIGLGFPLKTLAKPAQRNLPSSELARITFVPSSDRPRPTTRTGGGASRGKCEQTNQPAMTLIVPSESAALTTSERPTLLAYIPQSKDNASSTNRKATLQLIPEKGSNAKFYQTELSLPNSRGVVQIQLPEDAPPLAVGEEYEWLLVVSCGSNLAPDSPAASAIVKRVALDNTLASQLEGQTVLRQAELLGQNGIWYDTIANLAKARRQQPDDLELTQSWQDILTTMGLQSVSTAPLLAP